MDCRDGSDLEGEMTKVTVQYCVNGQYGEFIAKSEELDAQSMVDKMWTTGKPGITFRFLGDHGILTPTGFTGDVRVYIPAKG